MIEATGGARGEWLPGYRIKILDGNHFAATERRIKELRAKGAGPLPGFGLVVLDPRLRMAIDVVCVEDGHAQERSRTDALLATVEAKDLWIDDRNFCTAGLLKGIAARGGFFITREHSGNAPCRLAGGREPAGRVETGEVNEQQIVLISAGSELPARRVGLRLDKPTRDGARFLDLLTNLPDSVPAEVIARPYRRRWTIETAFQELERSLGERSRRWAIPRRRCSPSARRWSPTTCSPQSRPASAESTDPRKSTKRSPPSTSRWMSAKACQPSSG